MGFLIGFYLQKTKQFKWQVPERPQDSQMEANLLGPLLKVPQTEHGCYGITMNQLRIFLVQLRLLALAYIPFAVV